MLPPRLRRALRALLRRRAVEREMDDEMRFHLEMEARALGREEGLAPDEASRRAALAFGGVDRHKEAARDDRLFRWVDDVVADLRYGARSLRRTPAFTVVAVISLGLGIGVNAAVFSYVDAVAFRPLPVREPGRLVAPFARQGTGDDYLSASYPTFQDLRREARGFRDIAAYTEGAVNLADEARVDVAWAAHVTGNYFPLLGVRPQLGRLLRPEDERQPVIVLGDALWRNRFGADPRIVGRAVRVNGAPFTVVGVLPPEFMGTRLFSFAPTLWTPIGMHARTIPGSDSLLTARAGGRFSLVGRLADGVSLAQAKASLDGVQRRLAVDFPALYEGVTYAVFSNRTPINVWFGAPERLQRIGRLALLGVACVLLIACADVANLLLARMSVRRREVAIRLSLGAARGRLVRQLLTESVLLASLGLLAAAPLAVLALHYASGAAPHTDFATAFHPALDWRVVRFTTAVALLAGFVFGLAPALQATSPRIALALRESGPGMAARRSRLRESLVVLQVTMSLVIVVAAGLFARSLRNAHAMDPGFRVAGGVVFTLDPRLGGGYDRARVRTLYATLLDRLAALPGVRAVTRATSFPLDGSASSTAVWAEGRGTSAASGLRTDVALVGPDYFGALGIPILEGRDFAPADSATPVEPVVVNEVLARKLWPSGSAVGRRLRVGPDSGDLAEVVGVMRTASYRQVGEAPRPAMAYSLYRSGASRTTVLVRYAGDPRLLYAAVRAEVARLDPELPVIGLKTLEQHVSTSYSAAEGGAWGAGTFGALALLLAASGIYGVISYAVAQRTREIAIRAALGARRAQVLRMVVGSGLRLTAIGIGLGVLVVIPMTRGVASLLYGVAPHDPLVLGAVVALLATTAALASLVPAWRATRVDPNLALRAE